MYSSFYFKDNNVNKFYMLIVHVSMYIYPIQRKCRYFFLSYALHLLRFLTLSHVFYFTLPPHWLLFYFFFFVFFFSAHILKYVRHFHISKNIYIFIWKNIPQTIISSTALLFSVYRHCVRHIKPKEKKFKKQIFIAVM